MPPLIPINYYPVINQGHTLRMAGKIDPWRMYYMSPTYKTPTICITPSFKPNEVLFFSYCEYILLEVNGTIDYNVLTSLN